MAIDEFYNSGPGYVPSYWELNLSTTDSDSSIGDSDRRFRVRSVSLPPYLTLAHEMVPVGIKYYSGVEHVDEVSFELEERNDFSSMESLLKEFNRVYDYSTRRFRVLSGESVFPDGELTLFKPDNGQWVVAATWALNNMRILSIGDLDFNQDSAEVLTYSVTFSVEEIIPGQLEEITT